MVMLFLDLGSHKIDTGGGAWPVIFLVAGYGQLAVNNYITRFPGGEKKTT
jgi:hypothetical protein